jgi:ribosomal protein S18 acetylase RimI-like enzyme
MKGFHMAPAEVRIVPRHDLSIAEIDHLEHRLYEDNRHAVGKYDGHRLDYVIEDSRNICVGAIAGCSRAGMAEIKQLWFDENCRGRGLGRALLEAAIAETTVRGCRSIWVMSYDFQAPRLYMKCGFKHVAVLPNWPPGHANFVLRYDIC